MDSRHAAYIGALDQGTTSTRFIIFDRGGRIVSSAQKEHEQIYPSAGWVEHDALEIWRRTLEVIDEAAEARGLRAEDLSSIGITNQRETTVVWDRTSGLPVANALVWQDTRVAESVARMAAEGGQNRFRARTGLPLTTYFSGLKLAWILDHVRGRARAGRGRGFAVRQHGQFSGVESDRRSGRGRAPDGCDQRQPDAADESGHTRLGRGDAGGVPDSAGDAAGDPVEQ